MSCLFSTLASPPGRCTLARPSARLTPSIWFRYAPPKLLSQLQIHANVVVKCQPNTMIKIKKFKKGDERKLSYLSRKCIVLINSKDITKKETAILYNHFTPGRFIQDAKRFKIYVAEYNNKIAGTATFDEGWIRAVFVNPIFHEKGIGKELMMHLEKIAKKFGFRSVNLKSSPFAKNFYNKIGYKKIKDIKGEVGHMILMKKKL